jgi:hypothetical protein
MTLKKELLQEILIMEQKGIEVHDYKTVRNYLIGLNRFDLVEWIDNNRSEYTKSILNREQHYIGFYYD